MKHTAVMEQLTSHLLRRLVAPMVILHAGLVAPDLAIQLVEKCIDCRIEIVAGFFSVHVFSRNMHRNFGCLFQLLDGQDHADAGDLVKMPNYGIQLVLQRSADSFLLLSLQGLA